MAWGPASWLLDAGKANSSQTTRSEDDSVNKTLPGRLSDWRRGQELRAMLAQADLAAAAKKCGLVYDAAMQRHEGPKEHPERPKRTEQIWGHMQDAGLVDACAAVEPRKAAKREILYVHSVEHVNKVLNSTNLCARQYSTARRAAESSETDKPLCMEIDDDQDTYISHGSADAARLAAGCVLSLADEIMARGKVQCGMAVVRPPGHHAKAAKTAGFCLFNNIAIAARHLQKVHGLKNVLILDWDVHHGDGTSSIFAEDSNVLFFSVHRYDVKGFFPGTGMLEDAGRGQGKGYTVNVPLSQGYTDADICHAIRHALVPILACFKPEFILVSAGFDAVHDDHIGGCHMTPQGFAWLTRCLYHLAQHYCQGRLLLALEGGYNSSMAAKCAAECVGALVLELAGAEPLTNSLPPLPEVRAGAQETHTKGSEKDKRNVPGAKTISTVRKLSELHNLFELQMPLAPDVSKFSSPEKKAKAKANPPSSRKNSEDVISSRIALEGDKVAVTETAKDKLESDVGWPHRKETTIAASKKTEELKEFERRNGRAEKVLEPRLAWQGDLQRVVADATGTGLKDQQRRRWQKYIWAVNALLLALVLSQLAVFQSHEDLQEEATHPPTKGSQISVVLPQGRSIELPIASLETIGMLKAAVEQKEPEFRVSHQELLFGGRELRDSVKLSEYNISDGAVLHCKPRKIMDRKPGLQEPQHGKEVETGLPQDAKKMSEVKKASVTQVEQPQAQKPKDEQRKAKKQKAEQTKMQKLKEEKAKLEKAKAQKPKAERPKEQPKAGMPKVEKLKAGTPKDEATVKKPKPTKPKADFRETTKTERRSQPVPRDDARAMPLTGKGSKRSLQVLASHPSGYYMTQTDGLSSELWVFIPVQDTLKSKDIKVSITSTALSVHLVNEEAPLLAGKFVQPMKSQDSFWELGKDKGRRCIRLTLKKQDVSLPLSQLLRAENILDAVDG